MKRQTIFRLVGAFLVGLGVLGFMTVADDLRHVGEFFGVAGVLVSGLAFLGAGTDALSHHLALHWVPAGIACGLVVGVALDVTPAAVTSGFVAGLILALILRKQRQIGA